jgi:hypothetical protein
MGNARDRDGRPEPGRGGPAEDGNLDPGGRFYSAHARAGIIFFPSVLLLFSEKE